MGIVAAAAWTIQAGMSFNLVCTGTITSRLGTEPTTERIRVDLESRRYCFDDCRRVTPIAQVTDGEIVFEQDAPGAGTMPIDRRVDRANWQYVSRVQLAGGEIRTVAQCEVQPFTGFGAATRK